MARQRLLADKDLQAERTRRLVAFLAIPKVFFAKSRLVVMTTGTSLPFTREMLLFIGLGNLASGGAGLRLMTLIATQALAGTVRNMSKAFFGPRTIAAFPGIASAATVAFAAITDATARRVA